MTPAPTPEPLDSFALAAGSHYRRANIAAARQDPAIFMRLVLKDESTGKPIVQAPIHDEWQDLLTDSPRVVLWSHIEAGKSNQITIGRVLWEIGRNPSIRIAIVCSTARLAQKFIRTISQYIETSEDLHAIFPELRRSLDRRAPWNTSAITVDRPFVSKDPTVQGCGYRGRILGSRVDLLVVDDVIDGENSDTSEKRAALFDWIKKTPMGRLTDGARVWVHGNAWHPQDAMHRLASESWFSARRFPAVDNSGDPTWPERWPIERLAQARKDLGGLEFARQLLCVARSEEEAQFQRAWIDAALARGRGVSLVPRVPSLPDGFAIFTGVDLGVSQSEDADLTALVTILVYPGDHPTRPRWRQILCIEAGRWSAPEIVKRIDDHAERYGGIVIVENVAAQDYLLQFAKKLTRATLRPFRTGKNKADPTFGVASIAAELEAGLWLFPAGKTGVAHPQIEALTAELLYYDPRSHTGDRLMALWFARAAALLWERQSDVRRRASARASLLEAVDNSAAAAPAPADPSVFSLADMR